MSTDTLRLGICAGEPSGDILAGAILRNWKQRGAQLELAGIGGEQMQAAGLDSLCAVDRLAVMAALNLTNELLTQSERASALGSQQAQVSSRLDTQNAEIASLSAKVDAAISRLKS